KPGGCKLYAQLRAHNFQRDLLLILSVGSDRSIYCAHSTHRELLDNLISANALAHWQAKVSLLNKVHVKWHNRIEHVCACLLVGNDQRLDFAPQREVHAGVIQKAWPAGWFKFQSRLQDRADLAPLLRGHARAPPRLISRNSQARAEAQERFTVAGEIPRN